MTEIALATALMIVLVFVLTGLVLGARAVLMPGGPVAIIVNGSTTIAGAGGRRLLPVLNDGGIAVPSACAGAGTCGLCRVKVVEGGGEVLPTERAKISPKDLREGQRLACQITLRGPIAIMVPDDVLDAQRWMSRVVSARLVAPLIRELVLDVPQDMAFTFRAGAYVQIEAPPYELDFERIEIDPAHEPAWRAMDLRRLKSRGAIPTHRAYSIASRPQDAGLIVLNIRLAVPPPGSEDHVPPGIVSSYLFGLRAGDAVSLSGPFGEFRVQDSGREMVFIGGGVGMAPLRAMIHEQLAAGTARRISFWYGARSNADLFYREEFDALAAAHANFTWTPALSQPEAGAGWDGPTGFIHDVVRQRYLEAHPAPEECEYYLCGPPLMIQAVLAMLDELGVEPSSIFNDDFGI